MKEFNSNNYVIEVQGSMRNVSAKDWDALLETQTEPTPFMRHAYLSAMEESGSASAKSGWKLQLVTMWRPLAQVTRLRRVDGCVQQRVA